LLVRAEEGPHLRLQLRVRTVSNPYSKSDLMRHASSTLTAISCDNKRLGAMLAAPGGCCVTAGAADTWTSEATSPADARPSGPAATRGAPPRTAQRTQRAQPRRRARARRGTHCALGGCINDAHCMAYLLKSRFGFQDADITLLSDDQGDPSRWPTRANMLCAAGFAAGASLRPEQGPRVRADVLARGGVFGCGSQRVLQCDC